ncbi:MAG: hypothetical protein ABSB01_03265 [Streptosporangiaceae bacterium]|jgi:hypothetical protein
MSDDRLNQFRAGYAVDAYIGDEPPDLDPLRALAERAELADAVTRLCDSYGRPLPDDDPLVPLAHDIARVLTEAGFTLHHCAHGHPRYRLAAGRACCRSPAAMIRKAVSWTTHDLLSLDRDRWNEYHGTHEVMNGALSQVLDALGYQVWPFGLGGAWIVTGRRDCGEEGGR